MIANYHTHTWRCNHAKGTEREYVEQAIAGGMKILGFADHTPYPFPDGHNSSHRMFVHQTEDYFRTLTDLKREYASQIDIHIGVEAEYYPAYFHLLTEFLKDYPCEYMLLGQHFLENEDTNEHASRIPPDPQVLHRYVNQVLEAVSTRQFLYIAHPDMVKWTGDPDVYRQEMTRLCIGAKEQNCPVEINLLGVYEHRNYPCPAFWEVASEVGNDVVIGCDAHVPEALNRPETEKEALEIIANYNLRYLPTLPLS